MERRTVFPSVRSVGMTLVLSGLMILLILLLCVALLFFRGVLRIAFVLLYAAVFALTLYVYFHTYYVFEEDELVLISGPFRESIAYEKIKTAVKTRGFSYSMALAFDRIELNYGLHTDGSRWVMSPVDEDDFLDELAVHCPDLQIRG